MASPANFLDLIGRQAVERPHATAVIRAAGDALCFAELAETLKQTRERLAELGIGPQDRVGVVLPDGPDTALVMLALIGAASCCPVDPKSTEAEYDSFLRRVRPSAVLVMSELSPRARAACSARGVPVIEVQPRRSLLDGPIRLRPLGPRSPRHGGTRAGESLLLHTSGTTDEVSSLVPLSLANITAGALATCRAYRLGPADRRLNVMPMFHVQGLVGSLIASLVSGGSVLCAPAFSPAALLDLVAANEITWFSASPTMHRRVLEHAEDGGRPAHSLRFVRSGSAALPTSLRVRMEDVFQVPVVESYGMTEAHQIASTPLETDGPRRLFPTGARVAILSGGSAPSSRPLRRGEILVSGENVITRYADRDPAEDPRFVDGWFRTGDEGELQPDGSLRITGRLKELINRGGEKVSPFEVEEVLLGHASVREATVFPVPDPDLMEEIAAAVVLRGTVGVESQELRSFAAARLAPHKVPRYFTFLDTLPTTGNGKPSRRLLRQAHAQEPIRPVQVAARSGDAPRTPLEEKLLALWVAALDGLRPGVHDDFYVLGGESIAAVTLLTAVQDRLGVGITPLAFADRASTIASMADFITAARQEGGHADGT